MIFWDLQKQIDLLKLLFITSAPTPAIEAMGMNINATKQLHSTFGQLWWFLEQKGQINPEFWLKCCVKAIVPIFHFER